MTILLALAGVGTGQVQRTYAALTASEPLRENVFVAAELSSDPGPPDPPAACAHLTFEGVYLLSDDGDLEWIAGESVPVGDGTGAFHGTARNDLIVNIGGQRTIHGESGDDCLVAGPGGDQLHGGRGNDIVLGGEGSDKLHGLFGDNLLDGEEGRDVCSPGPGNDILIDCDIPYDGATTGTGP